MNVAAQMDETVDVVVVGSGAAGLAAAITAAHHGLSVTVLEKHPRFGGTSAWSGGWLWIPRNPLAREAGIEEPPDLIRTYLRAVLGNNHDSDRIEAFLQAGPLMVGFLRDLGMEWRDGNAVPDMLGDLPGAGTGGRSVTVAPFDGRRLGRDLHRLRRPKRETTFMGMGIASGADLGHFLQVTRSVASFWHVSRRFLRHLLDSAWHGRGMHLVNGNALVARLAAIAFAQGVEIRTSTPASGLLRQDGRVGGVMLPDGRRIHARRGVVLAAGGYPADPARRRTSFPHAPTGQEHWTAAPPENTGDGLALGESVGGRIDAALLHPASWAPVSLVPCRNRPPGHFPHLIERAKPGIIAVTADGRRFANEADGYHQFIGRLLQVTPQGQRPVCWLIADHRFVRRYGLGHAKPAPVPLWPSIRSGYLKRGRTLRDLATACGIDPVGLEATIAAYNEHAQHGRDPAFGRGETPYNRAGGDAGHGPNPCVAPIGDGPFYAVEVVPGSLGTFAGLAVDARARVLDGAEAPIAGLYAVGTDAASVMGGTYPAGGINLGPGMSFGFLAGRDLAGLPALTGQHAEQEMTA
ncbi:Succinate dehydrogenase/fumarate reductase, flavoprotein subunit [Paracoccus alcaliphilus]|uniref:Succinate dehydrogenase/fumarate reductase, flavoprotein subunit n=1 Tax=Paracoccus alcaliphilus TaxID=34002 RepID=A0A1H8F3W4_9RHOB|nr:FAD-dependent oxidoreductase [Paracoccus alcaliphilus]SEN26443.1 Succinate dehydrogenase/fumarate reductase, flavoprotein subunit [Paracoccus alcaliphilus]